MKYLFIILVVLSPLAQAIDLKPGLWKVNSTLNHNGKTIDHKAQMAKAMANMPEAKRKQMMEMMGKMNAGMASDGSMQVCYSDAIKKNPASLSQQKDRKCKTNITTNTSEKVVMEYKCEDGATGDATWTMKGSNAYQGVMNINKQGKKSTIKYDGEFVSADCGKVKPII